MGQIKTSRFIWMGGRLVRWANAKVHVMTHALHYGSAVFEGIHSYKTGKGTAIFRLSEHVERFFHSMHAIGMKPAFAKKDVANAIKEIVRVNKLDDAYIRPLAYFGYGKVGVYPAENKTEIAIIAVPWGEYYSGALEIGTSKYVRHPEKSTVFGAKISGNYANSILAMEDARKNGYDEALMLDYHGYVSEGPVENIFIVKRNSLVTPDSRSALHGITRGSLMEIAKGMGLKVYEKKVTLREVKNADEAFFCGTATEIVPVISVDGKKIGNGKAGKMTLAIGEKFKNVVRGRDKKYAKWLTYVG